MLRQFAPLKDSLLYIVPSGRHGAQEWCHPGRKKATSPIARMRWRSRRCVATVPGEASNVQGPRVAKRGQLGSRTYRKLYKI